MLLAAANNTKFTTPPIRSTHLTAEALSIISNENTAPVAWATVDWITLSSFFPTEAIFWCFTYLSS